MSTATPGFSTDNNVLFDVGKEVGRVPGSQRHGLVLLNLKKHIINLKAQDHGGRRRTCLGMTPPDVNKFGAELIESIEGLADIEDGSPINLAALTLSAVLPKILAALNVSGQNPQGYSDGILCIVVSDIMSISSVSQCCSLSDYSFHSVLRTLVCLRFFIVPAMIKPASVCTKSTVSPSRISRWRFTVPTEVLKVKLPEQSGFTIYVPVPVTIDPPLEKLSVLTSFVIVPCPSKTA